MALPRGSFIIIDVMEYPITVLYIGHLPFQADLLARAQRLFPFAVISSISTS